MGRVVVLLGPPGSGKSTVGALLGERGLRWRDWEAMILERWGSRDAFVADERRALPWLHDEIIRWIDCEDEIAVIESVGLADAALLDRLEHDASAFVVRFDVTELVAMSRVRRRPRHQHLTDDVEWNRVIWREFYDVVAPSRRVDLAIDAEAMPADQIASHILQRAAP